MMITFLDPPALGITRYLLQYEESALIYRVHRILMVQDDRLLVRNNVRITYG